MIEYVVSIGLPLLVTLIMSFKTGKLVISREKQTPVAIVVFFVLFYLLLALRSDKIGVDLKRYIYLFNTSELLPLNDYVKKRATELVFHMIVRFIHMIAGVRTFLFIVSFFIVLPTAVLYFIESEKPMLSIAFYMILPMFGMAFSGLRQSIAIAIVGLSFFFVKKRKLLLFLVLIGVAMLFHNTAVLGLLLYPVYRIKYRKWMLFIVIPAIILVLIFNESIFKFLAGFLGDVYEHSASITHTGATRMLMLFALILAFSFAFADESRMDEETIGLRNIAVLAIFVQCFSLVNPIAMRVNYYYILFLPLLVPKIINRSKDRYLVLSNIIGWVMTAYFMFYFFYRLLSGGDAFQIYPYSFFFSG